MNDFYLGLLLGFSSFIFLEPLYVNFIYLTNCDLFLDIILFKKQRNKLIDACFKRYGG